MAVATNMPAEMNMPATNATSGVNGMARAPDAVSTGCSGTPDANATADADVATGADATAENGTEATDAAMTVTVSGNGTVVTTETTEDEVLSDGALVTRTRSVTVSSNSSTAERSSFQERDSTSSSSSGSSFSRFSRSEESSSEGGVSRQEFTDTMEPDDGGS